MKRAILILASLLLAGSTAGQQFHVEAWDVSQIHASSNGQLFSFHGDPLTGAIAFKVYESSPLLVGRLDQILVRTIDGRCFSGRVLENRETREMKYMTIPCIHVERIEKVYKKEANRVMREFISDPLEKIGD